MPVPLDPCAGMGSLTETFAEEFRKRAPSRATLEAYGPWAKGATLPLTQEAMDALVERPRVR